MAKDKDGGICVDLETKNSILEMDKNLNAKLTTAIKDLTSSIMKEFEKMKDSIQELFNKDIEYLKEQNQQFKTWHQKHFDGLEKIQERVTKLEGEDTGKDKAEQSFAQKNGLNIAIISIIVGILIAVIPNIL